MDDDVCAEVVVRVALRSLGDGLAGCIGYDRELRSYFAEISVVDGERRHVVLDPGREGIGAVTDFRELVEALPMVDWSEDRTAVLELATRLGVDVASLTTP